MRKTSLALLILAACGGDSEPLDRASAMIGPAGGAVVTPKGAAIDIPPGALSTTQEITLTETDDPLPSGPWDASSKLYLCTPEGTTFAAPARLRLPAGAAPAGSTIFWSRPGNTGYNDLGATRSGAFLEAQIGHFSTGFIGKSEECFVGACVTCSDNSRCAESCTDCSYEGGQWSGCVCAAACTPCE
jgi:hypothetical protein